MKSGLSINAFEMHNVGFSRIMVLVIWFLSTNLSLHAQQYQFEQFDESDGLMSPFVNVVEQDTNGYLLVGTGEGVFKFDGLEFFPVSIQNNFDTHITASFRDEDGCLWFGNRSGGLAKMGKEILDIVIPDDPERGMVKSIISPKNQDIWIACQSSCILKLSKSGQIETISEGLEEYNLYDLCISAVGELIVATDMGLLIGRISDNGKIVFTAPDELNGMMVVSILQTRNNNLLIATAYDGIYERSEEMFTLVTSDRVDFKEIQINAISHGMNDDYWVSSNSGSLFSIRKDLKTEKYISKKMGSGKWSKLSMSCAYEDLESVLWVGTKGLGLLKLIDNQFVLTKPITDKGTSLISLSKVNESIYSIGESQLYFQEDSQSDFVVLKDLSTSIGSSSLTSLAVQPGKCVWLGTSGQGLVKYDVLNGSVHKLSLDKGNSGDAINHIQLHGDKLYVSTDYGLYVLVNGKVSEHFTILNGLNHNKVNGIFYESESRIWIAGFSGLSLYENNQITNVDLPEISGIPEISGVCKDGDGQIWASTKGSGIFLSQDEGSTWKKYAKRDGLLSDHCSALVYDQNHYVWVAHRGGLSRIETGSVEFRLYQPELASTAVFNENSICAYNNDVLLFGINSGLLIYKKSNDLLNFREPIVRFSSILISGVEHAFQPIINLTAGHYSVLFDFVALSLKNPKGVQYQYMLEGYDLEWSQYNSSSRVSYGKLGPGTYTFMVKAYNSDGIGGNEIKRIKIFIDKPFWQKWWFITLAIFLSLIAVRFILITREKKLKNAQKKLEEKLSERTFELVEKNRVMSLFNKDITDSIHYAKNIQNAILPSKDDLEFYFKNSFVFNLPRNIVSGDFFWVEQFDRKIVIACVDCTGHGVPGAFMSIIGAKLLKDNLHLKEVQSPSDLLFLIDKSIESTLNSSLQNKYLRDGMDAAVVEIDLDSLQMRFAGAKRPVIIATQEEFIEIKGDRFSLGGNIGNGVMQFTLHSRQLKSGDQIYLFSDGITDQFGGHMKRKLKNVGFQQFLNQLKGTKMSDRGSRFEDLYTTWKGDNMQVDDILVVGIEVVKED
jgi:ligand-binding sensor domain-containing protein/serine phosphatase RsbU (regulator of sigma subunit)